MNRFSKLTTFRLKLLRRLLHFWIRTFFHPKVDHRNSIDLKKPVIYALSFSSLSNLLVLEQACIDHQLPRPLSPPQDPRIPNKRAYFSLSYRQAFVFKPNRLRSIQPELASLIALLEQDPDFDIQIVPISVFWGRVGGGPERDRTFFKLLVSDYWSVVGRLRKLFTILFNGNNTEIRFSRPVSLRTLVQGTASHQHAARKLARLLRIHFRRVRTSVTGPDLSHRRTLVNTLLTADTVQQVIVQEAKNKGQSVEKIAALARDYADEIAADYSYATVRFLDKVLTWLWNRLYAGIEVKHIERVHRLAKDYELIFTPCHRSHIDYLLLSYVLGHNGLMIPHIAAGKNLNMPIIGAILRRGGAFFMRRSFAGDRLYAAVFNKYLETIIAKGFAIEYFIEGGRSRTGRLLPPRTGMLNMTIRSHLANPHRPIAFIPIYIGYDRVLEGGSYLKELRGRKKKQESIIDIFKVLGRLKQPHGKVYLNFGEEVLLDHILPSSFTIDQDNKSEQLSNAINQLAQQIMVNINQATVVSGVNLIALILLSASNQTLDEPTLVGCIKAYVSLLRQVPYSQALVLPDCKPEQLIHYVEGIGPLQRQPHQLGDILALTPRSSVLMTYYRNNIVQLFVLPSIIACLVLHSHQLQQSTLLERCEQLYPYLQAELFLPWPVTTLTSVIHTWLAALVKHQWLVVDETSVANYCCPARQTNHYFNLELLSRTVAPSLERYYLLLALLIRQGKTGLLQTELENKAVLMGQRLAALHGLNAPEFFDKSLFKGFLQVLHKQHYLDKTTDNKLVANKQTKQLQQLVGQLITADILHSIEHITGSYTRHSE